MIKTLVKCEFLKIKRSKLLLIAFFGSLFGPILLAGIGIFLWKDKENGLVFSGLLDTSYTMLYRLSGPILCVLIILYIFVREYRDKTLTSIALTGISKRKLILAKFITLGVFVVFIVLLNFFWVALLSLVCILVGLPVSGFSILYCFLYLFNTLPGILFLFCSIAPFAFLAVVARNYFLPIIALTITMLSGIMIPSNYAISALLPWISSQLLLSFSKETFLEQTGIPAEVSMMILFVTALIFIIATVFLFSKREITE